MLRSIFSTFRGTTPTLKIERYSVQTDHVHLIAISKCHGRKPVGIYDDFSKKV